MPYSQSFKLKNKLILKYPVKEACYSPIFVLQFLRPIYGIF